MPHILIADDDHLQLELRKRVVEEAGHEVSTAHSACQTLRSFKLRAADLVIMDLRFPNAEGLPDAREGLDLIRLIREISGEVPVLVLSGWPADIEGQPEELLVTKVMAKPVKSAVLLRTIGELTATSAPWRGRSLPSVSP